MKKIAIYYFTGSGNTLKAAHKVKERFEEHDFTCCLEKMEEQGLDVSPERLKEMDYIGLMFPVAIQSTYPLVWAFIEKLPAINGQKVFMIDTMEQFSGGVVGPLRKVLSDKGYDCVGALEIKMSSSMQTKEMDSQKLHEKNRLALIEATAFVDDLLSGRANWGHVPLLSGWMRNISKKDDIWVKHSKKLEIVHTSCVVCNICVKNCPVKALASVEGKIVIDHNKCNSCMRCVHGCPKDAFLLEGKKVIRLE